jgi:transposase-like protein
VKKVYDHVRRTKAKVALDTVKGHKKVNEIAQEFGVHSTQVGLWKKALRENAGQWFDVKRGPKSIDPQSDQERLYAKIDHLNKELDWLKKVRNRPLSQRQGWVDAGNGLIRGGPVPIGGHCTVYGLCR